MPQPLDDLSWLRLQTGSQARMVERSRIVGVTTSPTIFTRVTVEDNYVGGRGSELAEAAAAKDGAPRVHGLAVRNMLKSGRKADDVLAYLHLAVSNIVTAEADLAR